MTPTKLTPSCNLAKELVEAIERIVYKSGDDTDRTTSNSFERLQKRIEAIEAGLYLHFRALENGMEETKELIRQSTAPLKTAGGAAQSELPA